MTGTDLGVADAFATALCVAGREALPLIEALRDFDALIIDFDGDFEMTSGFHAAPAPSRTTH